MQVDGAGAVGQACGDVDDFAADGRGPRPGVVGCGQVPGGAGQVVGDARAGQPCTVGTEVARGQVGQGPVDEVCVDLFDDRVATVLGFGLFEDERGVGEHREVAVLGEQLVLAGARPRVQAFDPAHDQPGGDRMAGAFEGGVYGFGDLRVGDPPLLVLVPDRLRIANVDPPVGGDALTGGADLRVDAGSDREPGTIAPARPDDLLGVERRVHPYDDQPAGPAGLRG